MKIGDRVIYRNYEDDILDSEKAEVIRIDAGDIQIRFESIKICSECGIIANEENCPNCGEIEIDGAPSRDSKMTWWAEPESLSLDKEWHRDERLKELGICFIKK